MIKPLHHRTKIVATIGPASKSPEIIRQMVNAGMNVARLNFSHGSYEDHAEMVGLLRQVSKECNAPITLLQDLHLSCNPSILAEHFENCVVSFASLHLLHSFIFAIF